LIVVIAINDITVEYLEIFACFIQIFLPMMHLWMIAF